MSIKTSCQGEIITLFVMIVLPQTVCFCANSFESETKKYVKNQQKSTQIRKC